MSSSPRFAIARESLSDGLARVAGAELHHMRDVARLRVGDEVTLFDEDGAQYSGRIARFDAAGALVAVATADRRNTDNRSQVILATALIKGPRMDFLVEKAAELGASELWPLICERVVVRSVGSERSDRWHRLAVAAAKQSLAPRTMCIRKPLGVADLAANVPKETLPLLCDPQGEPLGALLHNARPHAIILACGPEGGFAPDEVAMMRASGFITARLGPNRLRSETAALVALGIAAAALDEPNKGI